MPHCRICKIEIDKEKDDWVMPSRNYYYHRKCYEDWKQSTPATDEEYKAYIFDFIARDLKVSYDYHMCKAQIEKFVKENKMTVKGIFFTLKYFYEVRNGDWNKGHGGIGIVPFVYNEACTYWKQLEDKNKGTISAIERQLKEASERETKVIRKKTSKKKKKFTLEDVMETEDDE